MAESIFQTYLNRLTDLSSKNRALYLSKLEGTGLVDVRSFDFLNSEPAFEIIRKLIQGKRQFALIPEVDPRMGETNQLSKSLARIAFQDQLTQEETGDQSLYLAWPFVEGKLINGHVLRAPLLLMTVSLVRKNGNWMLHSENNWFWNPAFLLAYRHAYGNDISTESLEAALLDLSDDPMEFRTQLTKILSDNFSIRLSSTLFEDQITAFPASQTSLDLDHFEEGKLSLRTYAVLGQFAQRGNFLFREYEELIDQLGELSLEELMVRFFDSKDHLPIPPEEQLFPVFPMDASQENVLVKVRQGKSLVVEGPPGTGKSQLIANLVSDYISRGKKVLVVSQKRAALDVVFERMQKAGFGDFLALVHDFRADHRVLFEKLKKQIDSVDSYLEQNRGIDSIQLEREMSRLSRRISGLSEKFEELRKDLFQEFPAGLPAKALYLQAKIGDPALDAKSHLLKLNDEQAKRFEGEFRIFNSYQHKFRTGFWANRLSFAQVEAGNFGRIHQSLEEIEQTRSKVPSRFQFAKWVKMVSQRLKSVVQPSPIFLLKKSLNQLPNREHALALIVQAKEIKKLERIQKWLELALPELSQLKFTLVEEEHQLKLLKEELALLVPKSVYFFGKIIAQWSKGKFPYTFQALAENGLKFEFDALSGLEREATTRIRLQQEFRDLPEVACLSVKGFSKEKLLDLLDQVNGIVYWNRDWKACGELHELEDWSKMNFSTFDSCLTEIMDWMSEFEKSLPAWRLWLSSAQILDVLQVGLAGLSLGDQWSRNQTFLELVGFDQFRLDWGSERLELAGELETQFPTQPIEGKIAAFRNGWCLAWIGELERRYPVLAELGSLKLSLEMEELKTAILDQGKISRHMALLRLREQVSSHLEVNRLGNRLTYRELHHQVNKKRLRWSIRKLVEEMDKEVFRLLPCWLASPETVSALFPLKGKFDLVIFDEASQCPVERGLPAMLRGKQVVIAGDSRQLRPSDFYQVKWESEEEGMEFEAESLLELAGHFFEKQQLKGHYRSADPGLIYFSNAHFYGGQLETLPDYPTARAGKTPFTWQKTEGIWEKQLNKTEAAAVAERVKSILTLAPGDSIGIVTGNYFQMELIRETLWKEGIQDGEIKVRNIENVQGDEFDQVILSLGYAPNREGRLITNFGLLGKAGAENRLNVAVTRARKMMHVISSIDPEDFRPGQLQNQGLALLREFLGFVKSQSKRRNIPAPEVGALGYEVDWSLKNRLLELDLAYSKDIPSSVMDLVKIDALGDSLAVLTDDQRFFNAPTAKAAMAYHPILLEEKGWRWEWMWSRRF